MTNEETKREDRNAPKFPRRKGTPLDPEVIAKSIVDAALKDDDPKIKKK